MVQVQLMLLYVKCILRVRWNQSVICFCIGYEDPIENTCGDDVELFFVEQIFARIERNNKRKRKLSELSTRILEFRYYYINHWVSEGKKRFWATTDCSQCVILFIIIICRIYAIITLQVHVILIFYTLNL